MCPGVFLLGFILYGTLCASWISLTISFSMLGKFSPIIFVSVLSISSLVESTYNSYHMIFAFSDISLSMLIYIAANGIILFFLMVE